MSIITVYSQAETYTVISSKTFTVFKSLILFTCLMLAAFANAQPVGTTNRKTILSEKLMAKSRTQRAIGWFMAGTGIPIALSTIYFLTFPDDALSEKGKVAVVLLASSVYTIKGINLIKRGRENKRQAVLLTLIRQPITTPFASRGYQWQSAISLQIPLH